MTQTVIIPTKGIGNAISNFTVGFVKLEIQDNVEDAVGAGSGTLVHVGKVFGILTAAHVLDHLPDAGPVGLVQYLDGKLHYRKQTIEMRGAAKIILRGDEFGVDGPDLAFLRLPPESLGWIRAINSFYNLEKHRTDADKAPPSEQSVDAVVGMIEERTRNLPPERQNERRKGFEALFSNGQIVAERTAHEFSLFEFIPAEYPDFQLPGNYQGTSGGAVWRLFLKLVDDGAPEVTAYQLWGIPYYQSKDDLGKITLTCHATTGVYGPLLQKIIAAWPKEAADQS